MKTRIRVPQLLDLWCSVFVATAASGQVVLTWTNHTGGLITATTSWDPNGLLNGNDGSGFQQTACWGGRTTEDLIITNATATLPNTGFGSLGINFLLTPEQTNSVQIISSVSASPALAVFGVTNKSASAAFTLGERTPNYLTLRMRPAGVAHYWVNNSAAPFTINPSVRWEAGGGVSYELDLGGSGDWIINNTLAPDGGPQTSITKSGSGTMIWTAPGILPSLIGPVIVNGGTLLVNGTNAAASTFVSAGTLGGTGTLSGPVTLLMGTTLAPGASAGSIGTLTINSNLTIGGNMLIEVDKSHSPSNDSVGGSVLLSAHGGATIIVSNIGPALKVGDKFTVLSNPSITPPLNVTGSGVVWSNALAFDGSISVIGVLTPTLNFTNFGNSVQFSWTGDFKLQAQTNKPGVGISTSWADYPGGDVSPATVPIGVTNETVFFRLVQMP